MKFEFGNVNIYGKYVIKTNYGKLTISNKITVKK